MSLRPTSANWFELLVMREDLAAAMKALAASQRVELQSHGEARAPMLMPECRELLEDFEELERHYRHHWPPPAPDENGDRDEPYEMLEHALARLRRWAADAEAVSATMTGWLGAHARPDLLRGGSREVLNRWTAAASAEDRALLDRRLAGWVRHFGYAPDEIGHRGAPPAQDAATAA